MPERSGFNPEANAKRERNETLRQAREHLTNAIEQLNTIPDTEGVRKIVESAAELLESEITAGESFSLAAEFACRPPSESRQP